MDWVFIGVENFIVYSSSSFVSFIFNKTSFFKLENLYILRSKLKIARVLKGVFAKKRRGVWAYGEK